MVIYMTTFVQMLHSSIAVTVRIHNYCSRLFFRSWGKFWLEIVDAI